MITNVTLTNFKCFRQVDLSPKRITLLVGSNGTGKSGLLQALLLLKQSENPAQGLTLEGDFVRLDRNDFSNHQARDIFPEIWFSLSGEFDIASEQIPAPVVFRLELRFSAEGALVNKFVRSDFLWEGHRIAIRQSPGAASIGGIPLQGILVPIEPAPGLELGTIGSPRTFPASTRAELSRALGSPVTLLSNMRFVPAIRGFARGYYPLGDELQNVLVSANGLSAQEEDTITALAYLPREVEQVSIWMNKVAGVGLKTELVPPKVVKPVSVTSAGQPNLLAEGSGANALVQLLFELARAGRGDTVLVEEPEIHLHPKAQAELASVLVEESIASDKQVIMTTHSEHIAGRLMTEIAEGKVSSSEVAIYSFDKNPEGICSADRVELTDEGQATGGLRSFFQTDLDEMRRYVDALRSKA